MRRISFLGDDQFGKIRRPMYLGLGLGFPFIVNLGLGFPYLVKGLPKMEIKISKYRNLG
jgi:hypothetical protein